MEEPESFVGRLLLALPGMQDDRFSHSVIAMCVHDANGALGISIGEEMEGVDLHGLLESFDLDGSRVENRPVLRGGPVEPRRGFVLHTLDWQGGDMVQVTGSRGQRWGLSGSLEILRAIARGHGPRRYAVALGYAGWAAGQLEAQMAGDSWFLGEADEALLFDVPTERKWSAGFAASGIDASHLVSGGGTA
jgi:putative transcriptional regulator